MTAVPPWSGSASGPYSPFAPSPLSGPALSSSDSPGRQGGAAHYSSDPAMPSSPTPPGRPTAARSASYKSRPSSSRRAAVVSSSSSPASPSFHLASSSPARGNALANETRRLAQENSRLSRARILKLHHLASRSRSSAAATTIPDGPGGWVGGEWEEFDDEELARLEVEARKARREYEYRIRRMEELASEEGAWIGPDEVDQVTGDEMDGEEPEPPLDVLFDESELETFDLPPERNDSIMLDDHDDDEEHARPRVPPPDPDPQPNPPAATAAAAFDSSLLSTPFCPACGATDRPLAGDGERGLYCAGGGGGAHPTGGCGWGIETSVLLPLREAFLLHGSPLTGHAPLLSFTPFTGTVVLCSEPDCDEQYGA